MLTFRRRQNAHDWYSWSAVVTENLALLGELGCDGQHLDDHRRVGEDVGPARAMRATRLTDPARVGGRPDAR